MSSVKTASTNGTSFLDPDQIKQVDEKDTSIIPTMAALLKDIIDENRGQSAAFQNGKHSNSFTCKKPPLISIEDYLKRITKYSKPERSTLILSLVYIDKVCEETSIPLTLLNIHRLLLASIVLAIKYNEDDYYSNTFYAKVGGITLPEINLIEYEFLANLNFRLFVDDDTFNKYRDYLLDYKL